MNLTGGGKGTNPGHRDGNHLSAPSRIVSLLAGAAALGASLRVARVPLVLAGGYLLYRGARGRCPVQVMASGRPTTVSRAVTVASSPSDLYRFCRRLENLTRIMPALETIDPQGETRYRCRARALGSMFEWDVDVVEDVPDRLVAWASAPGSALDLRGRVELQPVEARGTVVAVTLTHRLAAASILPALALLVGRPPEQFLTEALRRLKQLMETGEVASVRQQPAGERSLLSRLAETITAAPAGGRA
jgi:uncharacterized membrane protein